MGGRGAYSMSGRQRTGSMRNVGGAPDRRSDIQQMFREVGFTDVTGTNGIDAAVLGAYAIALNRLEREYGAISASDSPVFTTGNSTNTKAAVFYYEDRPSNQYMVISSDLMGTISTNVASQRRAVQSGHHAATDGKITSDARYTITHEYGHMLSNALAARSGMNATAFSNRAASEIRSIATSRYGAKRGSSVSDYGRTDSAEFFAESFASCHSGSPNAFGKAMRDWLKGNRL